MPLQLRFLGAPQVRYQDADLKFRSRKVLALLIYLVVEGGHHQREKLIDLFWPASGHKRGNATLRSTLARLKKTLAVAGDFLITKSGTIGFDCEQALKLDTKRLSEAAKSDQIEQLEAALALLRGEFLEGFSLTIPSPLI